MFQVSITTAKTFITFNQKFKNYKYCSMGP